MTKRASKMLIDGPVAAMEITGIKCDAPGCGYSDPNIPRHGEDYADYLNAPCPKCGASLLTEADLKLVQRITAGTNLLNRIGKALGLKSQRGKRSADDQIIPLSMHGDGSLTVHPMVKKGARK